MDSRIPGDDGVINKACFPITAVRLVRFSG
jgi:hypothetical protein